MANFSFAQSNSQDCDSNHAYCKGQRTFESGDIYDGEFSYGIPNGKGSIKFVNGDEYLGDFKTGNMNGTGTILLSNGDSYFGQWKDGEAHGIGTYKKIDGSSFTGGFEDGMRNGDGFMVWSTGDSIFGSWMEDRLDAMSVIKFSNGDQLKTYWKNGNMKVNAIYISEDGKKIQGSMNTIYMVTSMEEYFQEDIDQILANLQLGWLFIGMEYQASQNYELAVDFLKAAQNYGPSVSAHAPLVAQQLEAIDKEKSKGGWARLPKK